MGGVQKNKPLMRYFCRPTVIPDKTVRGHRGDDTEALRLPLILHSSLPTPTRYSFNTSFKLTVALPRSLGLGCVGLSFHPIM